MPAHPAIARLRCSASVALMALLPALGSCRDGTGSPPQPCVAASSPAPVASASSCPACTCECNCDTSAASPQGSSPAPKASGSASVAGADSPCGEDMLLVEGEYCPLVEQRCLEHKGDSDQNSDEAICLRFERPSKCVAPKLVHMRYCMDRYEYPNKAGELPRTLVDYRDASKLCAAQGKRLCSESEFNFACEGEEMRPYATGFERDATACNFDKPFRPRPGDMKDWDECMRDKSCKEQFDRVDQRMPAGANPKCVSPFGIYDLNGNANELVTLRYKTPPHRAAVKGGWWGPVRNRCRPIVTSHDEHYAGYEVGFRCCKRP